MLNLNFGISKNAHFKNLVILYWWIHGIDWLKLGKSWIWNVLFLLFTRIELDSNE